MRKRLSIIAVLVAMFMMLNTVAVSATDDREDKPEGVNFEFGATIYELTGPGTATENESAGTVVFNGEDNRLLGTSGPDFTAFVAMNETFTITAVPAQGYKFLMWKYDLNQGRDSDDPTNRPNPRTFTYDGSDGDVYPTPVFVKVYNVSATSNPAGIASFTGELSEVLDGAAYNVEYVMDDANYEFTGWTGTPSGTIDGANVELVANFKYVNLWVSADDHADLYIDGAMYTHNKSYNKAISYSIKNIDPFFAAKAWDNTGVANIAGFKLVYKDGEQVISTDSSWYYRLDGEDINTADLNGNFWYEEDYAANGWLPVTAFSLAQAPTPRNWAKDNEFPDASAKWIWGPNFDVPTAEVIDTPVYLRSFAPKAVYTVTFNTLGGTPTPESYDVASGTIISAPVEVPALADYTFEGWDYDFSQAILGNTTITAIYLPIESETPVVPTPQTVNYTLTVTATEGGTVPGFLGTNTFASGTNVNLEVTVEEGFEFVGFTGDVVDGVVIMNADKSVVATFAPIEEVIEEEPTPEATPDEDDEEILDEVTPEATPDEDIQDEALPQTGGIPASMMSVIGLGMTGIGFKIRKKK